MSKVDEIRARLAAATPGPWVVEPVETGRFARSEARVVASGGYVLLGLGDGEAGQARVPNAEFIAHAREDMPHLLAALDAVTTLAEEIKAVFVTDHSVDVQMRAVAYKLRAITEALEDKL